MCDIMANELQAVVEGFINNGLIYVIDVRNGLFIFKYTGPHADEVKEIHFLEGNSDLGDAVDLDENQQ